MAKVKEMDKKAELIVTTPPGRKRQRSQTSTITPKQF